MENLNLNQASLNFLTQIRSWTRIISIIMFIMIGFMILVGIMLSAMMKTLVSSELQTPMPFPAGTMALMYVLMAVLYFFPVYYLYRFSENLGHALNTGSEEALTTSLQFLKNHYTFVGVLLIIGIALMVLVFIITLFVGIAGFGAATGGEML